MTTPVVRRQPVLVMETGANPVVGGGPAAGWVSGNPAGLADGATSSAVFDLGPEWDQYPILQIIINPVGATSFTGVQIFGSDTPSYLSRRRLRSIDATGDFATFFNTVATAGGPQATSLRPAGRYITVIATNTAGSGAMGASAVTLVAYPA